jgi:hypothetical protein
MFELLKFSSILSADWPSTIPSIIVSYSVENLSAQEMAQKQRRVSATEFFISFSICYRKYRELPVSLLN